MKKTSLLTMTALVATTFLFSCNDTEKPIATDVSTPPAFDLANAKKEIETANRNFSDLVAKGDSVGLSNLYASDAKVMFAGAPPVVGRSNIQSTFGGMLKSGVSKVDLKTYDVFGNEDLLAEEGLATLYAKDKVVGEEKYIVLWKKEDGKWKLFRDITNSNLPAPTSKKKK